ncbi:MAG: DUF3576 domain-containing protein [Alphaproteobacteria bacterium]
MRTRYRLVARFFLTGCFITTCTILGACSGNYAAAPGSEKECNYTQRKRGECVFGSSQQPQGTLFGDSLTFGGKEKKGAEGGGGIGVNSWLWRASLDTVAFMPLAQADPFGGVILTDWYSPPESPDERLKVNIFILGTELRADGIKAQVFKNRKDVSGNWVESPVDPKTNTDLEDAILTRARQLRVANK